MYGFPNEQEKRIIVKYKLFVTGNFTSQEGKESQEKKLGEEKLHKKSGWVNARN